MATSVNEGEITWTFADDETVGQYADGSWWVVGPVSITAITPADSSPGDANDTDGSMVNPTPNGDQGLDYRADDYNRTLNIARSLPYAGVAGESIVSSKAASTDYFGQWIERVAVLTIVSGSPSSETFRPPMWGTDKSLSYTTSNLDYTELQTEATVTDTPSLATTESLFDTSGLPFCEWDQLWSAKYKMGTDNHPAYGRTIAHYVGEAMLQLQLNYSDAQKKTLLVKMVQWGIDEWGYYENGGTTKPDGGHKHGRKVCVVLAATQFNDADMLDIANDLLTFQEDQTTWEISADDVGRTVNSGNTYLTEDIGVAEWGIRHSTNPEQDNRLWDAPYRTVVGPSLVGHALAIQMMGFKTQWNNDKFFDYIDRLYEIEKDNHQDGYSNFITDFTYEMWEAYRGLTPPVGQVEPVTHSPVGSYYHGNVSVSLATTTVEDFLYYTDDGTIPTNASNVYSGAIPITSNKTINAFATKGGSTDSEPRDQTYQFSPWLSITDTWSNVSFTDSAYGYASFNLTPLELSVDAVVGFSNGVASAYTDLGLIVRCSIAGDIEFRNGGSYASDVSTQYAAGTSYFIAFTNINWTAKTFDGYVDGVLLASGYSFRTEQAALATIDNIALVDTTSLGFTVGDLSFNGAPSPAQPQSAASALLIA